MQCPNCRTVNRAGAQFCARCGYLLLVPRQPDGTIAQGTVLDKRYRLHKLLDEGGYGAVYLAADLRLPGRQCAVKETLDTSPAARQLFQQEAQLLARLQHPQLVRVSDYFSTPAGELFLVMDYIAGEDLAQALARTPGFLPEAQVVAWMTQVCAVLTYMHTWLDPQTSQRTPIIHREIKPGNLKLQADGTIMVIDLGIAKVKRAGGKTMGAARAVSPPYSPPEQYGLGTDERSDIYALGVTMYELLTKQLPPEAPHLAYQAALPPRQHNPHLSAGLVGAGNLAGDDGAP